MNNNTFKTNYVGSDGGVPPSAMAYASVIMEIDQWTNIVLKAFNLKLTNSALIWISSTLTEKIDKDVIFKKKIFSHDHSRIKWHLFYHFIPIDF